MMGRLKLVWLVPAVGIAMAVVAQADVLVSTNGERFVGTIVEETPGKVVFDSEIVGRLTLSRAQIRELQRTPPAETNSAAVSPPASTNTPVTQTSSNTLWLPPGVGRDGDDWIELKSGEWLRGRLRAIQNKDVEFDSDELEQLTLQLKDVRQVYPANPMDVRFENRELIHGGVVISNDIVTVTGPEMVSLSRDELIGITPGGGKRGIEYWSGNATLGLILQSGNNHQTTVNASVLLNRRTPNTSLRLDYLGNYSEVNELQNVNSDRLNLTYDVIFNGGWFVRPVQFEYFYDPLANIGLRLTGGVGAGYYIFDRPALEWIVSAGPSYQYTEFDAVEPGQDDRVNAAAAVLQTKFKYDITDRLTFRQTFQSTFTSEEAGEFTDHCVSTLEFEIKRHLDLDVSFIWDYLQNPQTLSDGVTPEKSDFYLTLGLGARF